MVATDIAGRGIDVDGIAHVVNFDLPNVPEDYVHRIGRTARAGATGDALSLVSPEDHPHVRGIEALVGHVIERRVVQGFAESRPVQERPGFQARSGFQARPANPPRPATQPRPAIQQRPETQPRPAVEAGHAGQARSGGEARPAGRLRPARTWRRF